jgi:polyisoprenoid-binding protein YceI
MKKIFFLLIALIFIFSCKNEKKPKEEISITSAAPVEKTQGIASAYLVKNTESKIFWTGAKAIGKHTGSLQISEGRLNVVDGSITTGDFDIHLKSLLVSDLKGKEKTELEEHLLASDFFEIEKFSIARFVISKVEKIENQANATHRISGDLTMKEVTKPVTFLAQISIENDKIKAVSQDFNINRTQWNMTYSSTILGIALDKAIKDEVGIKVELLAEKK